MAVIDEILAGYEALRPAQEALYQEREPEELLLGGVIGAR